MKNINFPIYINEIMKVEDAFGININIFKSSIKVNNKGEHKKEYAVS